MVEKIKLTFLGTGSAIPTARRNHLSMLLQYKAENILIDCGEGTQRQFRKAKLNPCKITKILISHWHADHTLGLSGLFMTMAMNGYNKNLEIYGPRGTSEKVRQYMDLVGRKGENLNIKVNEIKSGTVFDSDEFFIEAMEMDHDCPVLAYSFVVKEKKRLDKEKLEKLKIPNSPLIGELVRGKTVEINGKKVDGKKLMYVDPARKVSFILDTRYNEDIVKLAKGSNVLVSEATYSKEEQELATEYGHMSSVDAAKAAKKAKAEALVLVHLSQRYDAIPKVIMKEAKEVFENVRVVEDLEGIEF
jgi:ribonuclease Z